MRTRPGFRLLTSRVGRHIGFPNRGDLQGGEIVTPPSSGEWGTQTWMPDLPSSEVDVTIPTPTGTVWSVSTASELSAALSGSAYGDVIEIDADAVIEGNFTYPVKSGWSLGKWVLIRPSNHATLASSWPLESDGLPSAAQMTSIATNPRMTPSRATALTLPTIQVPASPGASAQDPAITIALGAQGLYCWGLRMQVSPSSTVENFGLLVTDPSGATSPADLPSYHVVNQCVLGSLSATHVRRAIQHHGSHLAAVNSTLIALDTGFSDSNAIWHAYGTGPFTYINNTEIANGENHFIGGLSLPSWHSGVIPSDFTFRHCHFYKPPSILVTHPDYAGTFYGCKNPWECKYGVRILIEKCIADGNIANSQNGQTWSIKQSSQGGASFTWCETGHVTLRYCKSLHCVAGISFYAAQPVGGATGIPTHDVLVEHNLDLIDDSGDYVSATYPAPNRYAFQPSGGGGATPLHWLLRHNTWVKPGRITFLESLHTITIQDNIVGEQAFAALGVIGNSQLDNGALNTYLTDSVFTQNGLGAHYHTLGGHLISAADFTDWPGNFYPGTDTAAGLNSDGTLAAGSAYLAGGTMDASDGTDLGADVATIEAGVAGVLFTEADL